MDEIGAVFGWLAGVVLVAAIVPHQVRTIRIIALLAGVLAVVSLVLSGAGFAWVAIAAAFVVLNLLRLSELYRRARSGTMTSEERELFDHVMQVEDPLRQSRLRDLMRWHDVPVGEQLITRGQVDPPLIYIASGRASIERDGVIVNECGGGEFLGEMSHITGKGASATVKVIEPMRVATIDRDALAQLSRGLPEIGRAVDNAFNRSLTVKVTRMNRSLEAARTGSSDNSET